MDIRSGVVQANLLIYEGRVIGGDICSLEQGGFMQGFDFPITETTTAAPTEAPAPTETTETQLAETETQPQTET